MKNRRWFLGAAGAAVASAALPFSADAAVLPLTAIEPTARAARVTVRLSSPTVRIAPYEEPAQLSLLKAGPAYTAYWTQDDRLYFRGFRVSGTPLSGRVAVREMLNIAGFTALNGGLAGFATSTRFEVERYDARGDLRASNWINRPDDVVDGRFFALNKSGEIIVIDQSPSNSLTLRVGQDEDYSSIEFPLEIMGIHALSVTAKNDIIVQSNTNTGTSSLKRINRAGLMLDDADGQPIIVGCAPLPSGAVAATANGSVLQIDYVGDVRRKVTIRTRETIFGPGQIVVTPHLVAVFFFFGNAELAAVVLDHAGKVVAPFRSIAKATAGVTELQLAAGIAISDRQIMLGFRSNGFYTSGLFVSPVTIG